METCKHCGLNLPPQSSPNSYHVCQGSVLEKYGNAIPRPTTFAAPVTVIYGVVTSQAISL